MLRAIFISFLLIVLLMGCKKEEIKPISVIKNYMFLGHTYDWERRNKIDSRLERLNFEHCDGLWLGGDICETTTENRSVVDYIDQFLLVSRPSTLWAIGNHDARGGNMHYITEKTGRPTFYSTNYNNLTFLVIDNFLDSEELYGDERCTKLQEQLDMILEVTDTIQHSTHLIVIQHLVTWGHSEPGMDTQEEANANNPWVEFTCDGNSRFHQIIYPLLKKVNDRGVKVIVISGDGGQRSKGYHFKADNGIDFLISGINNSIAEERWNDLPQFNFEPDSILLFKHDVNLGVLTWQFRALNSMIQ